jgi:rhomboid protease GluP
MSLFILVFFVGTLCLFKFQKFSLKDTAKSSILNNIVQNKGTLILGIILVLVAMLTFDGNETIKQHFWFLGLSRVGFLNLHLLFEPISCIFLHFNILHLFGNISALLLLSAYERRAGTLRFLTVFLVSGVVGAFIEAFLLPNETLGVGASGGLFGLFAAYFLDYDDISVKEWRNGFLYILLLTALFTFMAQYKKPKSDQVTVDWLAHVLGAVIGAFYTKAIPVFRKVLVFQSAENSSVS